MTPAPDKRTGGWQRLIPVTGVFCILGSLAWAIWRGVFDAGPIAFGALGVALFLTLFLKAEIANLRFYANSAAYTFFVAATCVVIFMGARSRDARLDLTPRKVHTLSGQTLLYLNLLKKDVRITVFDDDRRLYSGLLDRFDAASPRVSWSIHDPVREFDFARQFDRGVPMGTIYIQHGEESSRLVRTQLSEQAVANAIVSVTRDREIAVYFLAGHGELTLDPAGNSPGAPGGPRSLSLTRDHLLGLGMKVERLDLSDSGYIPEDAAMLVLAGPSHDLFDGELREIEEYLDGGGKLLVYFDLPYLQGISTDFTNLAGLLRARGLEDREMIIYDRMGEERENSKLRIRASAFSPNHPITRDMQRVTQPLVIPFVRGLVPVDPPPEGIVVAALMASSPESWLEPFAGRPLESEPAQRAQHGMGWAVERSRRGGGPGMRLVVFGSSLIVQNSYLRGHLTAQMLMDNTVKWLTEQEDLIAVPPKSRAITAMPLNAAELNLVLIVTAIALPAMLFFGGVTLTRVFARG